MNQAFDAVLFDCDGVLIDSEAITNQVLWRMLRDLGWHLSEDECMDIFLGRTIRSEAARIERETGQAFSEAWLQRFYERRNLALLEGVQAIAQVHETVREVHQRCGGRIACASGADRHKVELMLEHVGLMPYFEGRIFSGHETPRSKPHPDVYLAAAKALAVDPGRCLVVEDSPIGVTAGVAAGATVFGYVDAGNRHANPAALQQAGAVRIFHSMPELLQFV